MYSRGFRHPLILTGLQPGDEKLFDLENRFNGFTIALDPTAMD